MDEGIREILQLGVQALYASWGDNVGPDEMMYLDQALDWLAAQTAPVPLAAPSHDGWWFHLHNGNADFKPTVYRVDGETVWDGREDFYISEFTGLWWPITPPTQEE